ncbi:uncharacterized protein [Amphiura filiformis]
MCGLTTASFYSLYDGKQVYFCSRPCHEKYNAQKAKTPNILLIQLDKDKTQDDPQDAKEEDIFEACHRGDANSDRLVSLLEEGTSANLQNNQGQTLLTYSISKGDIRTTRVLLSAGADVDKRDNKSKTALMVAASIGAEKKMGVLLKRGANALLQDAEGKTALHMTESNTTPDCVKLLLHHEPELLNIKNNFDQTIAHLVAGAGNDTILTTLLNHGVCIDDLDNLGRAPLHYAVLEKAVTCVPILLAAINGVNVLNLADRFGSCPIHYAVQLNNTEIVKMLIEKDCDVNIPNPAGRTSLLIATAEGFWDICQLLVGKCDDINATDKEGFSALHYAARVGESELCRLLIKHGADVNLRNNQEQTPMFLAVSNGHTEVVHTLVEQGAKCDDITDARGRNLFHYAAENGHKAMLRVLLQYSEVCDGEGCDVCNPDDNPIHTKDDDGHTTLYLAVVNRHIDCIKMLIKRGVFVDEDSYRLLGEMGLIDIVDKKRRLGNEEEDDHYGNDREEEDFDYDGYDTTYAVENDNTLDQVVDVTDDADDNDATAADEDDDNDYDDYNDDEENDEQHSTVEDNEHRGDSGVEESDRSCKEETDESELDESNNETDDESVDNSTANIDDGDESERSVDEEEDIDSEIDGSEDEATNNSAENLDDDALIIGECGEDDIREHSTDEEEAPQDDDDDTIESLSDDQMNENKNTDDSQVETESSPDEDEHNISDQEKIENEAASCENLELIDKSIDADHIIEEESIEWTQEEYNKKESPELIEKGDDDDIKSEEESAECVQEEQNEKETPELIGESDDNIKEESAECVQDVQNETPATGSYDDGKHGIDIEEGKEVPVQNSNKHDVLAGNDTESTLEIITQEKTPCDANEIPTQSPECSVDIVHEEETNCIADAKVCVTESKVCVTDNEDCDFKNREQCDDDVESDETAADHEIDAMKNVEAETTGVALDSKARIKQDKERYRKDEIPDIKTREENTVVLEKQVKYKTTKLSLNPAVWKKKYMEQKKRTISLEDQLNKLKLQLDQHQKRMASNLERRQDRVNVLQRLRDPQLVLCQQTHDNELLRMHVQLVQTKAASETTLRNLRQKEINEIRSLRTDYRNAYATFAPKYQSINRLLNLPDWLLPTKVQYGTHPTKSKWTKASRKVTSQMKPFQKNGTYSETFSNRRISNSNQNEASNALEKPENRQSTKSAEF